MFFASAFYTVSRLTNPFYHLSGLILALGTIISDYYLSERRIARLASDRRFLEYGLLSLLRCGGPFLLRERKGPERLLTTVKPAAKIIFSGVLPPFGISMVPLLAFDYLESRRTLGIIGKSYEIGGKIGLMIAKGYSEREIRTQLSTF